MTDIYSSDTIHPLHHTIFQPEGEAKASLLIVHGMAEHSGRYAKFAQFLASQGIAVLTYDHLGHGKTAQSGELGFFSKTNPMQTLLNDTLTMSHLLKDTYSESPHFIMGHSMGSFVVRNLLNKHSQNFSGAILMGTSDKDPLANLLLPIASLLNKIMANQPSRVGTSTLNKVLNSKLKMKDLKSSFAWVSASEDNIKCYEADPLCGFNFTNNGYFTLLSLMKGALNMPWYENLANDFPLMIVSGEDDPVGNMGKGINALETRLNNAGLTKVTKILYPNMRHEILNEIDNDIVYNDIGNWIVTTQ